MYLLEAPCVKCVRISCSLVDNRSRFSASIDLPSVSGGVLSKAASGEGSPGAAVSCDCVRLLSIFVNPCGTTTPSTSTSSKDFNNPSGLISFFSKNPSAPASTAANNRSGCKCSLSTMMRRSLCRCFSIAISCRQVSASLSRPITATQCVSLNAGSGRSDRVEHSAATRNRLLSRTCISPARNSALLSTIAAGISWCLASAWIKNVLTSGDGKSAFAKLPETHRFSLPRSEFKEDSRRVSDIGCSGRCISSKVVIVVAASLSCCCLTDNAVCGTISWPLGRRRLNDRIGSRPGWKSSVILTSQTPRSGSIVG